MLQGESYEVLQSFSKNYNSISSQNWILDPEIDSNQRAHQNAHLIGEKGSIKHRQRIFLKNLVRIEHFKFWSYFGVFQGCHKHHCACVFNYLSLNIVLFA